MGQSKFVASSILIISMDNIFYGKWDNVSVCIVVF